MATVKWEKIRLPVDPKAIKPGETGIRGIKCNVVIQNDSNQDNEKCSTLHSGQNDNALMKFSMIFMCIVMSIFLVIFFMLKKEKIFSVFSKSSRPFNNAISSTTLNVAFANDELLLK